MFMSMSRSCAFCLVIFTIALAAFAPTTELICMQERGRLIKGELRISLSELMHTGTSKLGAAMLLL